MYPIDLSAKICSVFYIHRKNARQKYDASSYKTTYKLICTENLICQIGLSASIFLDYPKTFIYTENHGPSMSIKFLATRNSWEIQMEMVKLSSDTLSSNIIIFTNEQIICMYIILRLKEYHDSKRRRESGGRKATNAKTHV